MSKLTRKKQNILSIVIIVVGVIVSFAIFGSNKDSQKVEAEKLDFATKVGVMTMGEENSKIAEISRTAIFESIDLAEAVAEQAGRITSVNFKVGNQVQKGQILAIFDQSTLVNSAKIALEDSLITLNLAEDNLKKTKNSVEESLEIAKNNKQIDELELEQAEDSGVQDDIDLAEKNLDNSKDAEDKAKQDVEISINNAKIQVSQAQSTVRQNQIAYEKSIIRAPISGAVTAKKIELFDYISAGKRIAEISGVGQLKAKIFLNSFEINKIIEGDSAIIEISGKDYLGKIISLSRLANSDNNRYEVQVESSEDISSEANQAAKIKINLKLEPIEGFFFVPLSAVNIGQQKNTVFVYENGQAKTLKVEIGRTVGNQIEIKKGLKNGDQLIIVNNRGLRDSEKIEIQ